MQIANRNVLVNVPTGTRKYLDTNENAFVETKYQSKVLTEILQSYAVGDVCLVGKLYSLLFIIHCDIRKIS